MLQCGSSSEAAATFVSLFNQRMKICNGSPPNEASSTGPYLQQTPFHWVSLGPIFICWKECESTWPELGSWRQPRCDITLTDFVPLSPCFLPFALHQFVFVCSPGCSLLRFAHPEGRGQSGARVVLSARPLQPPFGGLPERWVTFAQRLHSSVLYSRPPIMQCFFCCFFFKSPSWVLTNTSNTLPLTYAFWACMSMCRRALGRPPARHKCWLLTFSSAVLCWHRLTLHFPLLFNYSIIGIPEVLQFTVRLLEGETHKHRHTCLHTLAFFPTHALAHAQEARMASVGLDVGARCGFRFRVRVISNFSPWNTILFCGETDN